MPIGEVTGLRAVTPHFTMRSPSRERAVAKRIIEVAKLGEREQSRFYQHPLGAPDTEREPKRSQIERSGPRAASSAPLLFRVEGADLPVQPA